MNNNPDFQGQNNASHCPRCGAPLEGGGFCGNCGLNLREAPKPAVDTLSVMDYIIMMVVFAIPVAGIVLMLYWGFGSRVPVNRKNFARANLAFYVISLVLSIVMMSVMGSAATTFMEGAVSLF